MILSILLNYCCGREIAANAEDERKAHRGMIFAVAVNLALLFFFKYYGFFLELVNSVTSVELTYRELALPVGISFYTFQGISYVVDVYRGKAKAQRSLLNFALYIALFPQLIAGPIVRYEDIEPQLAQRKVSARKLGQGAMLFLIGLAKRQYLRIHLRQYLRRFQPFQQVTFLFRWHGSAVSHMRLRSIMILADILIWRSDFRGCSVLN